jgi:hypothetical protein
MRYGLAAPPRRVRSDRHAPSSLGVGTSSRVRPTLRSARHAGRRRSRGRCASRPSVRARSVRSWRGATAGGASCGSGTRGWMSARSRLGTSSLRSLMRSAAPSPAPRQSRGCAAAARDRSRTSWLRDRESMTTLGRAPPGGLCALLGLVEYVALAEAPAVEGQDQEAMVAREQCPGHSRPALAKRGRRGEGSSSLAKRPPLSRRKSDGPRSKIDAGG